MALDTSIQEQNQSDHIESKVDSTTGSSESAHERLSELSVSFRLDPVCTLRYVERIAASAGL